MRVRTSQLAAPFLAGSFALCAGTVIADDAAHRRAAERYAASLTAQAFVAQAVSPETLAETLLEAFPALGREIVAGGETRASAVARDEYGPLVEEAERAVAAAALKTFSLEELEAINAFHATEEGRSIASKTGVFLDRLAERMEPQLEQALMRSVQRVAQGE